MLIWHNILMQIAHRIKYAVCTFYKFASIAIISAHLDRFRI